MEKQEQREIIAEKENIGEFSSFEEFEKYLIEGADAKFRKLIEHGEKSLTVFRKRPYQMINLDDRLYFVEIPGFCGDMPNALDVDVICEFEGLPQSAPKHRRRFFVKKSDIISAEIGGRFSDYFTRQCGYLVLTVKKRLGAKRLAFYLPGEVNQFVVRDFLKGVSRVSINSSQDSCKECKGRLLDKNESTVIGALVRYFNLKGRRMNVIHWLLAALAVAIVAATGFFPPAYHELLRGIAALLPLGIYINYVRHSGLLRLASPGGGKRSRYQKSRAECFIKITAPAICVLLSEISDFSKMKSLMDYEVLGIILTVLMVAPFVLLASKKSPDYFRRRLACVMMCLFYVFTSMNAVNRAIAFPVSSELYEPPKSFGRSVDYSTGRAYYADVLIPGDERRFEVTEEEYHRLETHELSVRVDEYVGLLGLKYYEFELAETGEEAKREADYPNLLERWNLKNVGTACGQDSSEGN